MADPYACEKFSAARRSLAEDPNKVQGRVAYVFKYDLWLIADHPTLPPDIVERLTTYAGQILATPDLKDEGRINIWANKLSDGEAMAIARWVCDCASRLEFEVWAMSRNEGPASKVTVAKRKTGSARENLTSSQKHPGGHASNRKAPAKNRTELTPSKKSASPTRAIKKTRGPAREAQQPRRTFP